MTTSRQQRGERGEQLAAEHLERLGWSILERRWRCRLGELNLVAQDGDTVVFVEVRARAAGAKVSARQSVGFPKQERVARAALYFIRARGLQRQRFRFDVIAIAAGTQGQERLEHVRGAFQLPERFW